MPGVRLLGENNIVEMGTCSSLTRNAPDCWTAWNVGQCLVRQLHELSSFLTVWNGCVTEEGNSQPTHPQLRSVSEYECVLGEHPLTPSFTTEGHPSSDPKSAWEERHCVRHMCVQILALPLLF